MNRQQKAVEKCDMCHGKGYFVVNASSPSLRRESTCNKCGGTGLKSNYELFQDKLGTLKRILRASTTIVELKAAWEGADFSFKNLTADDNKSLTQLKDGLKRAFSVALAA